MSVTITLTRSGGQGPSLPDDLQNRFTHLSAIHNRFHKLEHLQAKRLTHWIETVVEIAKQNGGASERKILAVATQ